MCFAAACGAAFDFRVAGEDGQQQGCVRVAGPASDRTADDSRCCHRGEAAARMNPLQNLSTE